MGTYMIEAVLKKYGLLEKEIKIYLAVLRLGPSSVRRLANESGVNRGTTYDILKKLTADGLVNYYAKGKRNFIAEDPRKLADAIEERQEKLKRVKVSIEDILPELKSIYDNAENRPKVKYFEGKEGVKIVLQDILDTMEKYDANKYLVYSVSEVRKILVESFPEFTDKRIKANITVKVLAIGKGGKLCGLDERKWISKEATQAQTYTLIYRGRVAFISLQAESEPISVIIEDPGLFETQSLVFNHLWEKV